MKEGRVPQTSECITNHVCLDQGLTGFGKLSLYQQHIWNWTGVSLQLTGCSAQQNVFSTQWTKIYICFPQKFLLKISKTEHIHSKTQSTTMTSLYSGKTRMSKYSVAAGCNIHETNVIRSNLGCKNVIDLHCYDAGIIQVFILGCP